MTNIFNYRYRTHLEALEGLDRLVSKLKNKTNSNVTLKQSTYGYWNLKLIINNEESNTNESRVFDILA